jgi:hypothetical protein
MDGDLHLALQDATGDKAGIVVCEIAAKQQWCSIRETVFSCTTTKFPFHTSSAKKLNVTDPPIIIAAFLCSLRQPQNRCQWPE